MAVSGSGPFLSAGRLPPDALADACAPDACVPDACVPDACADAKQSLRRALRSQRRRLADARGPEAARALVRSVEAFGFPPAGTGVAGYWPIGGEIDPRPLMEALGEAGCRLALPVIVAADAPLRFRSWQPGQALLPGACGTWEPSHDAAPLVPGVSGGGPNRVPDWVPDWVLVPLVGFDAAGRRLGQGGGFYDRTLSALSRVGGVFSLGLAFAGQEVGALPCAPHDHPLDAVATEEGVRPFSAAARARRNLLS